MFEKASNIYSENIRTMSLVALVQVVLGTIYYLVAKLIVGGTEVFNTHNLIGGTTLNFENTEVLYENGSVGMFILGIIAIIIAPMIACYVNIVIKKILKNEGVIHKEAFKEGLSFYWRYVGTSILVGLIIAGISLLLGLIGMVFSIMPILNIVVFIAIFIGIVYVSIIVVPCVHVMVYDDLTISEGLSRGMNIGKTYFWGIVGVGILVGILSSIINLIGGAFSLTVVFVIVTFINCIIENFLIMYYMVLCKEGSL